MATAVVKYYAFPGLSAITCALRLKGSESGAAADTITLSEIGSTGCYSGTTAAGLAGSYWATLTGGMVDGGFVQMTDDTSDHLIQAGAYDWSTNDKASNVQSRLPAALTTNGNMKSSLVEILTTAITEGAAGRLAAAWQKCWNVAASVFTSASVNQTGDAYADTETILGRLTASRAGYLDNLNVGGSVASHADIVAINQSASKHLILTTVGQYEPGETYTVECRTFSAVDGSVVNADTTPTLAATGQASGSLSSNLSAATNPATGVYRWTYTPGATPTIEQIRMDVSATISSATFTLSAYTQTIDEATVVWTTTDQSHLTSIFNKLPTNNIADETLLLAAIGTPMQTYTQPTGFLAATFPGTVASTTNITAATGVVVSSGVITTLTNLPTIPANWLTAAGIAAGALNGKGDWSTYAGGDTAGTTTLLGRITAARAGYVDNLNIGGAVASHADILNFTQSMPNAMVVTSDVYWIETGTTLYPVYLYLWNAAGALTDADGGVGGITSVVTNGAGTDRSGNFSGWTHASTGVYTATYSVANNAVLEPLILKFTGTTASVAFVGVSQPAVASEATLAFSSTDRTHLTSIFNKLPVNNIADETILLAALGSPMQTGTVVLAAVQPNYTPSKAGDKMDLVNAPNATAITAIQVGLATTTLITNLQTHGDSTWGTATGFATHGDATSIIASIGTPMQAGPVTVSTVSTGAISSSSFTVGPVTGVATGILEQMRQLWRKFFSPADINKITGHMHTYADDGTTPYTTQTVADDGVTQTQGPAT